VWRGGVPSPQGEGSEEGAVMAYFREFICAKFFFSV